MLNCSKCFTGRYSNSSLIKMEVNTIIIHILQVKLYIVIKYFAQG